MIDDEPIPVADDVIIKSVADSMRQGVTEPTPELEAAKRAYRAKIEAAEQRERIRRIEDEERRREAVAQCEREEVARQKAEREKALRERIKARTESALPMQDRRLDEVAHGIQRAEAFRNAALNDAARAKFWNEFDEAFRALKDSFVPPPLPLVRAIREDDE